MAAPPSQKTARLHAAADKLLYAFRVVGAEPSADYLPLSGTTLRLNASILALELLEAIIGARFEAAVRKPFYFSDSLTNMDIVLLALRSLVPEDKRVFSAEAVASGNIDQICDLVDILAALASQVTTGRELSEEDSFAQQKPGATDLGDEPLARRPGHGSDQADGSNISAGHLFEMAGRNDLTASDQPDLKHDRSVSDPSGPGGQDAARAEQDADDLKRELERDLQFIESYLTRASPQRNPAAHSRLEQELDLERPPPLMQRATVVSAGKRPVRMKRPGELKRAKSAPISDEEKAIRAEANSKKRLARKTCETQARTMRNWLHEADRMESVWERRTDPDNIHRALDCQHNFKQSVVEFEKLVSAAMEANRELLQPEVFIERLVSRVPVPLATTAKQVERQLNREDREIRSAMQVHAQFMANLQRHLLSVAMTHTLDGPDTGTTAAKLQRQLKTEGKKYIQEAIGALTSIYVNRVGSLRNRNRNIYNEVQERMSEEAFELKLQSHAQYDRLSKMRRDERNAVRRAMTGPSIAR